MSEGAATIAAPPPRHRNHRPGPKSRRGRSARAVGVLGEVVVTAGVLGLLFVIWQVWWTDVTASRERQRIVATIEETFPGPSVEKTAAPRQGDPPRVPPVGVGEAFATLHVPRWGADHQVPVVEGVGMADVFNTGAAGHYPDTALPGELGNFALAAHRQSYGAAFHHIDALETGDALIVQTARAWLVYRVTEAQIVTPDRVDVLAPTPGQPDAHPRVRTITLTTCHPLWSTAERWVTHGELTEWYDRSDGMPAELLEDA